MTNLKDATFSQLQNELKRREKLAGVAEKGNPIRIAHTNSDGKKIESEFYYLNFTFDGVRYRQITPCREFSDAVRYQNEIKERLRNGLPAFEESKTIKSVPIQDAISSYLQSMKDRKFSAETIYRKRRFYFRFLSYQHSRTIETPKDITLKLVADYFRSNDFGSLTQDNYRRYLVSFLNWCASNRIIDSNPVSTFKPLVKVGKNYKASRTREYAILSPEEVIRVSSVCATFHVELRLKTKPNSIQWQVDLSERTGQTIGAFIAFLGLTGARPIEAMRLRYSDLRLSDPMPHVRFPAIYTKTKTERIVPLAPQLVSILKEERKNRSTFEGSPIKDDSKIWTSNRTKKLYHLADYVKVAGLSFADGLKLSPYSLRHSAATTLRSLGIRDDVICAMLGTSQAMLNHVYAVATSADAAKAIQALSAKMSGNGLTTDQNTDSSNGSKVITDKRLG